MVSEKKMTLPNGTINGIGQLGTNIPGNIVNPLVKGRA
jgi:hypothetical protein